MALAPRGLVFRDAAVVRPTSEVVRELLDDLAAAAADGGQARDAALQRALLTAGALECALVDGGSPLGVPAEAVTDRLAEALLETRPLEVRALCAVVDRWHDETPLRLRTPAAFAYHALWPAAFARAALAIDANAVCIVGVRTLGVTLSAVVASALRSAGRRVDRFTVRPNGDPLEPRLALGRLEHGLIERYRDEGLSFVVLSEGPEHSASEFLAVGEALAAAGVPRSRIIFFGSRAADSTARRDAESAQRWQRFHTIVTPSEPTWLRPGERNLTGGVWRLELGSEPAAWPPVWPALERLKALSPDHLRFRKFEGLGRYGDRCYERAAALAEAGVTPPPLTPLDAGGFVVYPWLPGRALSAADADRARVLDLARYIHARGSLLPAAEEACAATREALEEMARVNAAVELGVAEVDAPLLYTRRPAAVDARMHPHEWLEAEGRLLKTDATSHGDDQLFPGPTDIAWDLAGAIVEWELGADLRRLLLGAYVELSGDDPNDRVRGYEIAYSAFHARACVVAAGMSPAEESARWQKAHAKYHRALVGALER